MHHLSALNPGMDDVIKLILQVNWIRENGAIRWTLESALKHLMKYSVRKTRHKTYMQKMKLGLAVALAACMLSGCGKEQIQI
mgnify:CR=1 FL=1